MVFGYKIPEDSYLLHLPDELMSNFLVRLSSNSRSKRLVEVIESALSDLGYGNHMSPPFHC